MWRVSEPLQSPLLTIQSSLCGGQWAEPVSQSDVMLKPPHYNYADSAPSPASLHQSLCKNETENDASLGFIKHNIDSINRTHMCIFLCRFLQWGIECLSLHLLRDIKHVSMDHTNQYPIKYRNCYGCVHQNYNK